MELRLSTLVPVAVTLTVVTLAVTEGGGNVFTQGVPDTCLSGPHHKVCVTVVVLVLKKISLKQNKSHSRSLDLHLVFINEGLPEYYNPSDWLL